MLLVPERIFLVSDSGQNRVHFRDYQNMDFRNSLMGGRMISKLTPKLLLTKSKKKPRPPWQFWVTVITDMQTHLCKQKLYFGVVKHKSLLHTGMSFIGICMLA